MAPRTGRKLAAQGCAPANTAQASTPAANTNPANNPVLTGGQVNVPAAAQATGTGNTQTQNQNAGPSSAMAARNIDHPVDTEMTDVDTRVANPSVPESGTVNPAVTTTEVRGVTQGVNNLAVDGPDRTGTAGTHQAHNPTAPSPNTPVVAPAATFSARDVQLIVNQAVSTAVEAAVTQTRTTLLSALERTTQVPTPARMSDKLGVRDLKLPEFKGSRNKGSNFIEPDFYLPLLTWTKEVLVLLGASGLSQRQQAFSVVNALAGAARRSFLRTYPDLNLESTTPDDVMRKLIALVPDHKAMFTQSEQISEPECL